MSYQYMFEDGTPSMWPLSREQAIEEKKMKWSEPGHCPHCGCTKTFYTTTGECSYCTMITMERVRFVKKHGPDVPYGQYTAAPYPSATDPLDDREKVLELAKIHGVVSDKPCKHGHVKIVNAAGQCVQCEAAKNTRNVAQAENEPTYMSLQPCKKCLGFHPRCTHTRQCTNCDRKERDSDSATARLMADNPDMVISKEDAQAFGFTVFRTGQPCKRGHTGWRWVANGGCMECMKEKRGAS